jgi:hypothetical protein
MRRAIGVVVAVPVLLFIGLVAATQDADAHGGGLNKCGCHFNRKTGECHCHQDRGCGCACEPSHCSKKK